MHNEQGKLYLAPQCTALWENTPGGVQETAPPPSFENRILGAPLWSPHSGTCHKAQDTPHTNEFKQLSRLTSSVAMTQFGLVHLKKG
jgi:hypothetical protein